MFIGRPFDDTSLFLDEMFFVYLIGGFSDKNSWIRIGVAKDTCVDMDKSVIMVAFKSEKIKRNVELEDILWKVTLIRRKIL